MEWKASVTVLVLYLAALGPCEAQGMEQVAANVSCLAAGFTSCCTAPTIEGCRTRGPSGCYCDQGCYTSVGRQCCADIGTICDSCSPNPCQNSGMCMNTTGNFTCTCSFGFTGSLCETDINFCTSSPCLNGGSCSEGRFSFSCTCPPGFTGHQCQMDIDNCASNPCVNGSCSNEIGDDYTCTCDRGFTGRNCDANIDDCATVACQNGGTCVDGIENFVCMCPPMLAGRFCGDNSSCLPAENDCQNNGVCVVGTEGSTNCSCVEGFMGQFCEIEVNECLSEPCQNNGTCLDGINQFECLCPPNFTGTRCEMDVDLCATMPCQNGALCIEDSGFIQCFCRNGFTGEHCQTNINDCLIMNVVCQNGGTCVDGVASFHCNCSDDFVGRYCEFPISHPCAATPCQNSGTCVILNDTAYSCVCPSEFTGPDCGTEITPCFIEPCHHLATCVNQGTTYECVCQPGFTGQNCDVNINECASEPCQNNATCVDGLDRYACDCQQGFEGIDCETNIDDCSPNLCLNNATCLDLVAGYSCMCVLGYTGNDCDIEINECASNPCQNGSCIDEIGSFSCLCDRGYTGTLCDINIPDCIGNPCANNGTCVDLVDDFMCICPPGYTNHNCITNIDDCRPDSCSNNSTCIDGIEGFTCACSPGFTGNSCDQVIDFCDPFPCSNGATCTSELEGFICTCLTGFTGSRCETRINPCDLSPCLNNATCSELNDTFACACPLGFTGEVCGTQLDICTLDPCQNNGTCFSSPGAYTCQCMPGFTGVMCELDVDECGVMSNPCMNGGRCMNLPGGFECMCLNGFTGQFCQENVNDCVPEPCMNNGTCIDQVASYFCNCTQGYRGTNCEIDIDLCDPNPCTSQATCVQNLTAGSVECLCLPGLRGATCDLDIDECQSPSPCLNGGTCVNTHGSFICHCAAGFSGTTCDNNFNNDCLPNVCFNGATCVDIGNTFECLCPPGYTGVLCDAPTNECSSQPCLNGGQCIDGFLNYTCNCPSDFTGPRCEFNLNPCSSNPCENGASCTNGPGLEEFQCSCLSGFNGTLCELNIDDCAPTNPCMNGATCVDTVNNFTCNCSAGFGGELCEINIYNDCALDICLNGGDCVDIGADFICICAPGFTGSICEFGINECQDNPCLNGGTCRDFIAMFQCFCAEGYTGQLCETNIDDCLNADCNNGSCVDGINRFSCECDPGYTGVMCEVEVNECEGVVCQNGGSCLDLVNNFTCSCPLGYEGRFCGTDICAACENGSTCIASVNDFECMCPPGYTGVLCNIIINLCDSNPCQNNATCLPDVNTFSCACSPLFTGTVCDTEIDRCLIEQPCGNGSTCTPMVSDGLPSFRCTCSGPYSGERCEVFDPCLQFPCNNGGTCTNTPNNTMGYECQCPDTHNGLNCELLDICFVDTPCQNAGTCTNIVEGPGQLSYTCTCLSRFTGTNCTIEITPCSFEPCANGGLCVLDGSQDRGYFCQCDLGFLGENCTEAITVPAFSGQSYLTIPAPTSTISSSFALAFSLRTRTPTSLLIYATGTNESFIALELQAGLLVFRYSLGSGAAAVRGNFFPVADGSWHHIAISIQDGVGSLTIDNAAMFTSSTPTTVSQQVILISTLYIGGVGNFSFLHPQLLSHTSGLVGCITDFTLNWSSVNLLERALSGVRISQCVMGRCSSTTCLNGGICIDDTNSPLGYYCRCSLGFAGENCGQDINIIVPSFTGRSYSYLAQPPPSNVHDAFTIDLTLLTTSPNGLILYAAQSNTSDYISLELQEGRLLFQFDLGSGNVEVRSNSTFNDGEWHVVSISREGQMGYLVADGVRIANRTATGNFTQLNIISPLFIGGFTDYSTLPASVMQTGGFTGCIRDLQINGVSMDVVASAQLGFDVGQCPEPVCSYVECQNGGTCINRTTTPGFVCDCVSGFSGQFCESPVGLCVPNPCMFGGLCSQVVDTFSCLCPLGQGGRVCQDALNVTIPSFSGRSYITYQPLNLTTITVTLNPSAPNGLILFTSKSDSDFGDYLSIALVNYYIQFRYNLGSGAAIISSAQALQMNTWYTITVQLSGLNGTLYIDNLDPVFGQSTGPFTTLNVRSSLWLGGYMNFVNVSSITGTNQGFTGCVSSLSIDNMDIDLILDAESGYGVGMCNSSSCQGNPCFNGGSCLDAGSSFVCECVGGFTGPLCGSMVNLCTSDSCPQGSTCQPNINGLNFTCLCPLGRAGDDCEQVITVTTPSFNSTSYLEFPNLFSNTSTSTIRLIFNAAAPHGLLFYSGNTTLNRDFISLSLVDQRIEFRYDLGSGPAILISAPIVLNTWHTVYAARVRKDGVLVVDNMAPVRRQSVSTTTQLDVRGGIFVGGVRDYSHVSSMAGSEVGFIGCIDTLEIDGTTVDLVGSSVGGRGITQCLADPCLPNPCANGGSCQVEGTGYVCLCQLGFDGSTCNTAMNISVPYFGGRSYLAHPSLTNAFGVTFLYLEIRPNVSDGLLLYNKQQEGPDYIALLMRSGQVEFWYNLGMGAATIVSPTPLTLGDWHTIEASRNGRNGQLTVDNSLPVSGTSPGTFTSLQLGDPLLIGGAPNITVLPSQLNIKFGFTGCIREVRTRPLPLSSSIDLIGGATSGSGVTECASVRPCERNSCQNGGTCVDMGLDSFICVCPSGLTGQLCETSLCVLNNPCQNSGVCFVVEVNETAVQQCNCSLPFSGAFCTERLTITEAFIPPEGYLQYGVDGIPIRNFVVTTVVELTITPANLNGFIFYMGATLPYGDYLLIGLINGSLVYSFDLGSGPISIVSAQSLQVGYTYNISVERSDNRGSLSVSGQSSVAGSSPHGSFYLNLYQSDFVIYLGGAPTNTNISQITRGAFSTGFSGCISHIAIGPISRVSNLPLSSATSGHSITHCTA